MPCNTLAKPSREYEAEKYELSKEKWPVQMPL